jgi:hypothetical protein
MPVSSLGKKKHSVSFLNQICVYYVSPHNKINFVK